MLGATDLPTCLVCGDTVLMVLSAAGVASLLQANEPAEERPFRRAFVICGTWLSTAFRRRKRLSAAATSAIGALFLGFAAKLSLSGA